MNNKIKETNNRTDEALLAKPIKKTIKSQKEKLPIKVITVKGDSQLKINCKKIEDSYYLIDRDIFKINNSYVLEANTGIDQATGLRFNKSNMGDISLVLLEDDFLGYSSIVKYKFVRRYPASLKYVVRGCFDGYLAPYYSPNWKKNEKMFEYFGIVAEFSEEAMLYLEQSKLNAIRTHKIYNTTQYPEFTKLSKSLLPSNDKFSFLPGNYTYGFEIETSLGQFLQTNPIDYGFVTLYDGSISGHEYASIPIEKDKLLNIERFCKVLKKTHLTNKYCSVHIHIGNIPFSHDLLLALYSIFYRIQDELHEICSPYKKDLNYLANKFRGEAKDHCQYLPKLPELSVNNICDVFFRELKISPKDFRTSRSQEILEGTNKWNIHGRYFFTNFVNYCLKEGGTLELRLLQGTFNYDRIFNWLAINMAVINFAINNTELILKAKDKIFLEDCLSYTYKSNPKVLETLKNYIIDTKLTNHKSKIVNDMRDKDIYFGELDVVNFAL